MSERAGSYIYKVDQCSGGLRGSGLGDLVSECIIGFGGSPDDLYDIYAFTEETLIFIADYSI